MLPDISRSLSAPMEYERSRSLPEGCGLLLRQMQPVLDRPSAHARVRPHRERPVAVLGDAGPIREQVGDLAGDRALLLEAEPASRRSGVCSSMSGSCGNRSGLLMVVALGEESVMTLKTCL